MNPLYSDLSQALVFFAIMGHAAYHIGSSFKNTYRWSSILPYIYSSPTPYHFPATFRLLLNQPSLLVTAYLYF